MINLHPVCRVISGVEVQKRADEIAREHVRFGDRALALLRVVADDLALTGLLVRRDVANLAVFEA